MEVSLHRLKLLRELRYRGTVTAVADALHYSASAVSQQLSLLEREAETPLFERHGRRISLTEAGMVLADHSESILDAVESAGNAIESLRGASSATLRAGVWASVATGLLPTGLAILERRAPGVSVRSVELAPEAGSDAVRDGSLDLSFVIDYSNYAMPRIRTLERQTIAVERMYVAAPAGAAGPDPIDLAGLAADAWILSDSRSHFGRAVRLACREAGFEPDVRHVVGEQSTALALVAAGQGVTLVSDLGGMTPPPGAELTPLAGRFERNLSIAYRTRDSDRSSLQAFIDAMAEAALEVGLRAPGGQRPGT
ncbi:MULTISPECIES: LysR substrate-binding domain-containing protein [Gordonia]|uniref:Putative LysR family transcriptional regulator n=1 Tax=Gordonia sihwensis NBRC 108236 TaxID=1223544 RepID=L7LIK7_9ACTN|nr:MULTISPECIES: LysR substrate-binding domain-containing protein [Gordonia]AUH67892.1 LysR family transcriptional regulator [Gordonia sp. YC-JH1]KJR00053.1 LysR family transcriptional regulator [Gordonia sihwensis]GAC60714.1 putative LysR family transcriptional regulator [Gordonia sihwensis NBRC 108236]